MVKEYLSITETAKKWGLTPRRVRAMCLDGQIEGAAKLGNQWAVPVNAERPVDKRITTGEYKNWRERKKD